MKKLIEFIENDGRNLYQIAKAANVNYALLYRIVKGKTKKNIWLGTAFKLADALKCDVNEFREE